MLQDVSSFQPRIALISGGLKLGGSTTFLRNFAGELIQRSVPVEVFSFEKLNPLASDFESARVPVFCQNELSTLFEDRLEAILQKLSFFKPNVVLATLSAQSFEVLRYLPKEVFRIGMGQSDDPSVYQMMKCYVSTMDLMAVVSEAMQKKVAAMPEFRGVPVQYLPYGVPMPGRSTEARDFSGPLRILYLGRVDREQKRVHLFPTILQDLRVSGIPFVWNIAGDGPEKRWLEQELRTTSATQTVRFLGKISYADVPNVLSENDVFLLASDYEGLPLALLEAMGSGLVPVVSDLPSGVREVVDAKTGRLVPVDNVHGYAEAIVWLHHHRDELKQFSNNARERVKERFSVAAMTDRWLNVFPKQSVPIEWPKKWNFRPPLVGGNWLRFSLPGRIAKRIALKMFRG